MPCLALDWSTLSFHSETVDQEKDASPREWIRKARRESTRKTTFARAHLFFSLADYPWAEMVIGRSYYQKWFVIRCRVSDALQFWIG